MFSAAKLVANFRVASNPNSRGAACIQRLKPALPGDHPPPGPIPERNLGSCTRQNDVRLNFGGDLAIAMLACDGGRGVFGGGLQLVGAPRFDLVA